MYAVAPFGSSRIPLLTKSQCTTAPRQDHVPKEIRAGQPRLVNRISLCFGFLVACDKSAVSLEDVDKFETVSQSEDTTHLCQLQRDGLGSSWHTSVYVIAMCVKRGRNSLRARNRRLTVPTTVALETCRKWCIPTLACPFAKQPAVRRTRHRMLYAATAILLQHLPCTLSFSSVYTSSPLVLPILSIHSSRSV